MITFFESKWPIIVLFDMITLNSLIHDVQNVGIITHNDIGFWNFEQGTGTTAIDQTSNANDGTINGDPIELSEEEQTNLKDLEARSESQGSLNEEEVITVSGDEANLINAALQLQGNDLIAENDTVTITKDGELLIIDGNGNLAKDPVPLSAEQLGALAALETKMNGQVWNLGASNPQSVNKIVELLNSDVTYIPKRPGEPECTYADTAKIRSELNWKDKVSFEDGVKTLLLNIDYWKNAPLWTPDTIAIATKNWFKYLDE